MKNFRAADFFLILLAEEFRIHWLTGDDNFHLSLATPTSNHPQG